MKLRAIPLLCAALAASFAAGMYVGREHQSFVNQHRMQQAEAEFFSSQTAALSSGDVTRVEEALWAEVSFYQGKVAAPSAFRSAVSDPFAQVHAYTRLSELARDQGEDDRAAWLMSRAQAACKRTNWESCSPAEILGAVHKLSQPGIPLQSK